MHVHDNNSIFEHQKLRKMKNYSVISANEIKDLENEVNNLLNQGWKLTGGVSVAYKHEHAEHKHVPGHLVYTQALEKDKAIL